MHLHGLRVLHRDLSTKNILLSAPPCEGDIRVCDFGVAKALSLVHRPTACLVPGTPAMPWARSSSSNAVTPSPLLTPPHPSQVTVDKARMLVPVKLDLSNPNDRECASALQVKHLSSPEAHPSLLLASLFSSP